MANKEQFMLENCFHCGNKGLMKVESKISHQFGGPIFDADGNIEGMEEEESYTWTFLSCPVCHKVALHQTVRNDFNYFTDMDEEFLYPNTSMDLRGVPKTVRDYYEAALKVKNIDPAVCLLSLRRVMEAICKDKNAEGESLDQKVNWLIQQKIFPRMFSDAAYVVRKLGNNAAHADDFSFYQSQVEECMEYVYEMIRYTYVLPRKIRNSKNNLRRDMNT